MFGEGHRGRPAPRHLAGAVRSPAPLVPLADDEPGEVSPLARIQRSRLVLAVVVSLAALPALVLDNLPATAETNDGRVTTEAAAAVVRPDRQVLPTINVRPASVVSVAEPETTTTAAPVGTLPPTTEAPSTTEAPVAVTEAAVAPTTTAPAPPPPPPSVAPPSPSGDLSVWERLAACESSGNWSLNTGNGYYGGLQFSLATWRAVGGAGLPHEASKGEQIHRGQILQARSGWGQWPHCARQLGLL